MAERLLVIATPLALLAGGWVIFYVLKEPPRLDGCSEGRAPGVEEYREGLGAYATFSAAVVGGLIARVARSDLALFALIMTGWLALLYNAANSSFQVHATIAYVAVLAGGEVLLLLSSIATLVMPRPRIAELTYLWTALLLLLPAAAGFPAAEGVAFLCLD